MNSQHFDRSDPVRQDPAAPAASGASPAGMQGAGAGEVCRDPQAIAQAARSVMHPERHEPEWRYYHSAVPG